MWNVRGLYVESAVLVIACVLTQCGKGRRRTLCAGHNGLCTPPRGASVVLHPLRSDCVIADAPLAGGCAYAPSSVGRLARRA